MNLKSRKLIPIGILGGLLLLAAIIRMNPPEAPQRAAFTGPMMSVETLPVIARDYQIMLQSYGTVQPRTRSILIAQVGGQIALRFPLPEDTIGRCGLREETQLETHC